MATYTPNLNLRKDDPGEFYGVDKVNANLDKIDAAANKTSAGAPSTATAGSLGMLYFDTTNKLTYKCTAVSGNSYTWEGPLEYINHDGTYKQFNPYYSTYKATTSPINGYGGISPDKRKAVIVSGSTVHLYITDSDPKNPKHSTASCPASSIGAVWVYDDLVIVVPRASGNGTTIYLYRIVDDVLQNVVSRSFAYYSADYMGAGSGMLAYNHPAHAMFALNVSWNSNTQMCTVAFLKVDKITLDISTISSVSNVCIGKSSIAFGYDSIAFIYYNSANYGSGAKICLISLDGTNVSCGTRYQSSAINYSRAGASFYDHESKIFYFLEEVTPPSSYNWVRWDMVGKKLIGENGLSGNGLGIFVYNNEMYYVSPPTTLCKVSKTSFSIISTIQAKQIIYNPEMTSCGTGVLPTFKTERVMDLIFGHVAFGVNNSSLLEGLGISTIILCEPFSFGGV